MTVNRPSV